MAVTYVTLYPPGGNSTTVQVVEGSQLHMIYAEMGFSAIPSAPGPPKRPDPFPQYVHDDEIGDLLADAAVGATDPVVAGLVSNSSSATAGALRAAFAAADGDNVFTGRNKFDKGIGVGVYPDIKQPFNVTTVFDGPTLAASGSHINKVNGQFNTVIAGDFTSDADADSGFVWGQNVFTLVGSAAGDGAGLTNITSSLIEANVATPAGTTFDVVTGLEASTSFWGASAGAHINTMQSLYVRAPRRSGGTGGSVDSAYTLVVEGLDADGSAVGAASALSMWVTTGVTRLGGRLDVQNTIASNSNSLELVGTLGAACASLSLTAASVGGHAQIKLGASGSVFALTSSGGSNVFVIDNTGGLQLTLGSTTTAPAAGGAGALPATPTGYATLTINGTARKVAYY